MSKEAWLPQATLDGGELRSDCLFNVICGACIVSRSVTDELFMRVPAVL